MADLVVGAGEQRGIRSGLRFGRDRLSQSLIFVVLIALVAFFAALYPGEFFTGFNIRSIATIAAVTSFIAMGETYVIIGGGIDLSVGSVLVFAGICSAEVIDHVLGAGQSLTDLNAGKLPHEPALWQIIVVGGGVAVLAGAAWGVVNGVLTVKARIPDLIVTLGSLGAAYGLAQVITGGVDVNTPLNLTNEIGNGKVLGIPWLVAIAVGIALVMQVVLSATRFGRYTFAVGSNREAGRRVGINVDRHRIKLYVVSGALAGCGGFFSLALYTTTTIGAHSTDNLIAIAAVIIGGTSLFGGVGTIFGTIAGVLVPVVLQNGFVIMGLAPFWQPVAIGVVLVLAVWIDGLQRGWARR